MFFWDDRLQKLSADESKNIFLALHGCYIRSHYGSRCVLDIEQVAQFNPHLVVTLISDVYEMWWRTEARASGMAWRGRPTIEHLLFGRRAEVMVADQIALACKNRPRSLVVAASHPCDTLARCIFNPKARVAYLSFPISEPRRHQEKGDATALAEVSTFIRLAHEKQKQSDNLACICPLAIDELPFSKSFAGLAAENSSFNRDALRWSLADFWNTDECLTKPSEVHADFRVADVVQASGSIATDVGWRDYRLAEQADMLAVFNPVFRNRDTVSSGVATEITFATRFNHPIYVYQDPAQDTNDVLGKWIKGFGGGSMGQGPSSSLITRSDSLEEMLSLISAR
jgi:hypothetical protein